jgi:hypothetical protein
MDSAIAIKTRKNVANLSMEFKFINASYAI